MASTGELSAAHVILLATRLCSDANIEAFRSLRAHYPDVLSEEAVYRIILTFLPEETEPALYRPLLKDSLDEDGQFTSDLDTFPVHDLSAESARAQVQQLHLRQVLPFDSNHNTKEDLRSNFLLQRAHQVDTATGDLLAILQLVEPFVDDSELLRNWLISTLLPLLRKDYEYYPDNSTSLSLNEMEGLRGSGGVEILLQHAKKNPIDSAIGRDLRGIVGPWKYGGNQSKRRKVSHEDDMQRKISRGPMDDGDNWQDVNEWIISTSQSDHTLASRVVVEWDGPQDVDLGGYDSQAPSDLGGGLTL